MANPIIRLNIDGEQKVVVKPNNTQIVYTGGTNLNFIPSGGTQITQIGENVTIYSPIPDTALEFIQSGATVITKDNEKVTIYTPVITVPVNTSDLINNSGFITIGDVPAIPTNVSAFNNDANYITIGDVPAIPTKTSDLTNDSDYITNSSISQFWTSGQTVAYVESEISGLTTVVNWGDIQGTLSNQVDLQQALNGKTSVGDFTGHTNNLDIHYPMSGISITEGQISDLGDYVLQTTVTGLTSNFNSHTGDTSIHYAMSGISITEDQISDLGDYTLTGTTTALESTLNSHTGDASIHYPMSGISITKSQIDDFPTLFTGHTFTASGATEITVDGDNVTIYSPTGSTGGGGLVIETVTGDTYTISDDDKDKVLEFISTGLTGNCTVTFPTGITSGFQCNIVNISGEIIDLDKDTGVSLLTIGGYTSVKNQYGGVWVYLRETNKFIIQGDLS